MIRRTLQLSRFPVALSALALAAMVVTTSMPSHAQQSANAAAGKETDAAFIESLSDRYNTQPVDRQRLARLFFSVASTLDGGKSTVDFLRSRIPGRDLSRQSLSNALREMYRVYASQVGQFRNSSARLLDDPRSPQKLFRAMMDGHQSCWQLDRYSGMVETYGVSATDLMSILSSTEACERFRKAGFEDRVQDLVAAALGTDTEQAATIEDLREELAELQKLLEDLRAIDEN